MLFVVVCLFRETAVAGVHALGDVREIHGRLHEVHHDGVVVGMCYGRPNHALIRSAFDKFLLLVVSCCHFAVSCCHILSFVNFLSLEEAVVADARGERGVREVDCPIYEGAGSRGPRGGTREFARGRGVAWQNAALYDIEGVET